jgi:hypothetical protein
MESCSRFSVQVREVAGGQRNIESSPSPWGEADFPGTCRIVLAPSALRRLFCPPCKHIRTHSALPATDSISHSLSPAATQVEKCNRGCRGGDAISYSNNAVSHFIEKNRHFPLFLASSLLFQVQLIGPHAKGRMGKLREPDYEQSIG